MTNPIKAWSWSALSQYEKCPLQFKFARIDKVPVEQSPALARGNAVHKEIENYLRNRADMPECAEKFAWLLEDIRDYPMKVVEGEWAFTDKWRPTGWFGKNTWLRAKLDVGLQYEDNTGELFDWKTGKKYGENAEQVELFALVGFCMWPEMEKIETRLCYVDSGDQSHAEVHAKDVEKLKKKWSRRVEPMFNDTEFNATPGSPCRFCDFAKSKGGPCAYG